MSIYDNLSAQAGNGNSLKFAFQGGTTTTFHIVGDPLAVRQSFDNETARRAFFFPALKYNGAGEAEQVVVFKAGEMIWEDILTLAKNKRWGHPTKYSIEITATGEGKERRYKVMPGEKKGIVEEERKMIEEAKPSIEKYWSGIIDNDATKEVLSEGSVILDDPFAE